MAMSLTSPPDLRRDSPQNIVWAPSIPALDWRELRRVISVPGILQQASALRDGMSCSFIFESDEKPLGGSQTIIFVVEYSDGVKYAFRIPYHMRNFPSLKAWVSNELENWKAVAQCDTCLVPAVVGYSLSFDSPIRFPFIAYQWVSGRPLVWSDHEPPLVAQRDKVIKCVALFMINMACQLQKKGRTKAEGYVTAAIDRKIKRVLDGKLRTARLADCLHQRSLIPRYLIAELDDSPWVMVHGDLSAENIIVDEEHNVAGIIDFGFAEYLPFQFAASFPRFLDHETYQDQNDIDVAPEFAGDPGSSLVWRSKNTEMKRRDRRVFLDEIQSLSRVHGTVCAQFSQVLNMKFEIRRYWWFQAISNQKLHQVMVKLNWLLGDEEWNDEDVLHEWEQFKDGQLL